MAVKQLKLDFLAKIKKPEFQVRRKILSKIIEGERTSASKGRGIEFTGFRKYVYGDDASLIDWGASLRAKETLVREFEEYKNFQIMILMDVSDSMLFSSTDKLKCEYAAEMVFSLVYSVVNSGSKIGVAMFNDKLVTRIIPDAGTENYFKILKNLSNPLNYGGAFDMKKPLTQIRTILGEKSLIIIVSDFIGVDKEWHNYIRMLTKDFDVLVIMIRDPRDEEIPKDAGQFLIEDPFTGEKLHIDTKDYYDLYQKAAMRDEENIKRHFLNVKAGFIKVRTDQDYIRPLMQYVRLRARLMTKLET